MAQDFHSNGHSMVIYTRNEGPLYYGRWFCTCEKCSGETKAFPTEVAALAAAKKNLDHLYSAHPDSCPAAV